MKSITISITKIPPSKLFLFRWLCKLAKARLHVCQAKPRKKGEAVEGKVATA